MTARHLKPLATAGKPSERVGEKPALTFIDPADIVVDEDYQRAIGNQACQTAGVTILSVNPTNGDWQRGETIAVHALEMCMKAYGADTVVTALQCVTQTGEGNPGMLRAPVIKAVCSVLFDHKHWRDAGGALLDVMDNFDFTEAFENARQASQGEGPKPNMIEALRSQIIAFLTENLTVTEAA